jgi:phosphosulfolactate synthase (CoM biosynthesis protein A)
MDNLNFFPFELEADVEAFTTMALPYTLGATHFSNPIYITNYHISIVKFGWVGEDRASTKLVNSKVEFLHYTDIFPLETQTGKTNIFYIHS